MGKDLKVTILKMVTEKHNQSNGMCGLPLATLIYDCNCDYETIKLIINELFVDKKIRIRKGINGILIFKR